MSPSDSVQHWQIAAWTAGSIFGGLTFIVMLIFGFSKMNKNPPLNSNNNGFSELARTMNEFALNQTEYMATMKGYSRDMKGILVSLDTKQGETKDHVKEIIHIQQNTHKRIGEIESTLDIFEKVITADTFKGSVLAAFKEYNIAKG